MTSIALLGATGNVGSRLLDEALSRGHQVTALVRDPARLAPRTGLTMVAGDVARPETAQALAGCEVLLSSLRFADTAPAALLDFARAAGIPRLLIVGGAASLSLPDGSRLFDAPAFPAEYRHEAGAGIATLEALREVSDLDWVFVSPQMVFAPGERTGHFRLGRDALLFDTAGDSRISYEDFAVALLDEVERPAHHRTRFTIGY
ncbi:3-beta hydroxysteroid dehydrogenase [Pseudomonas oryzihabitans]|uniref:3-beta hydroxysteroid dehydrogenase n=1 Tax=Pseudomonas oryzihabitans TaxID=47885 RepID=A0A0U4XPB2_9PSED|nr:NAD(P)-dependent oxidoreductase [Pseudomonas oryzihabitans]ALZ82985.1 3-beta hydroxysteroid dehydrogenase [Pseudomonas oryzihabitans]